MLDLVQAIQAGRDDVNNFACLVFDLAGLVFESYGIASTHDAPNGDNS